MTHKQLVEKQEILSMAHQQYERDLNLRALFKVSNQKTGKDLVQETFVKTWKYLIRGGRIEKMKSFLYHVLNNLIIDEYRKNKTTSLDVLIEKGFEPIYDNVNRLFNFFDGKRALKLIEDLPKKYVEIMNMRYLKDLTIEEISRITGLSKNTVAVQLHRGLEKLKALYK